MLYALGQFHECPVSLLEDNLSEEVEVLRKVTTETLNMNEAKTPRRNLPKQAAEGKPRQKKKKFGKTTRSNH